jgi:DNA-directed RNA polymerase specialized sigma24 family protein
MHWSLVGAAQSDGVGQTRARLALEELCRSYWYPLYVFVRSRGYSSFDAQDLTQAFLVRFIESGGFASADHERGRFRTYLLGAMEQLRQESEAAGKGGLFVALRGSLTGEEPSRDETARKLGMSEGALKVAVHRLRQRYRALLRTEIAETVDRREDIEDELRHLVAVLRA